MNKPELDKKAIALVENAIGGGGPPEPRIVHCESEQAWNSILLRNMSDHRLNVLGREEDMIIFFDEQGREIGWRDDGRLGENLPLLAGRDAYRTMVVAELGLPRDAELGEMMPRQLPPVGWTLEGVFFLQPVPNPEDVVRVWTNPKSLRVIQCLRGGIKPEGDEK